MGKWRGRFDPTTMNSTATATTTNNTTNGHHRHLEVDGGGGDQDDQLEDGIGDDSTTPLRPIMNGGVQPVITNRNTNGRSTTMPLKTPPQTPPSPPRNGHTTTTVVDSQPPVIYTMNTELNGHDITEISDGLIVHDGISVANKNGKNNQHELDGDNDDEGDGDDFLCGIGSFKPNWLQPLANKRVFLAMFCLTSVLQGMYYTYFVSVLTTIEKLLQIQSKTTGLIMSAIELGQISGALFLTYYGGQGHRPRWIAAGMVIFAVASFLCSLPHFMFGMELTQGVHKSGSVSRSQLNMLNLCHSTVRSAPTPMTSVTTEHHMMEAAFGFTTAPAAYDHNGSSIGGWNDDFLQCDYIETQNLARITRMVMTIFFLSLLFIGIGAVAVYTLGIPYIDDNVANRDSPLYFAITLGVKIMGPVFGFLLGSFCTSIYVYPLEDPIFNNKDPRWISAWWLGLFIVAAALIVASVAMFLFPKELPHRKKVSGKDVPYRIPLPARKKPCIRDFPEAMKRLLKNDILLCRTASSVLHTLPIAGLYTFLPKYMESQFRMTAAAANMWTGMAGIAVMGVGIFGSGLFMRRFKPNARFVAGWIVVATLLYAIGMLILVFIGCPMESFASQGNVMSGVGQQIDCKNGCNCEQKIFAPICTNEGTTYFSACHAGCQGQILNQTGPEPLESFVNCTCASSSTSMATTATPGYCSLKCDIFPWYISIFSIFVLIYSTCEVGSMLLTLRCVAPKDKAMALGLISFAIGLFGNVPCSIIYGTVVDSACLVWEEICGERGACSLYDPTLFRSYFYGMTGAIMFAAFIVDVVVWYKAKNIKFSDEESANVVAVATADEEEAMVPMSPSPTDVVVIGADQSIDDAKVLQSVND